MEERDFEGELGFLPFFCFFAEVLGTSGDVAVPVLRRFFFSVELVNSGDVDMSSVGPSYPFGWSTGTFRGLPLFRLRGAVVSATVLSSVCMAGSSLRQLAHGTMLRKDDIKFARHVQFPLDH
jgi:hypothetical protein